MAIFEYTDTFNYPASTVFTRITDLEARKEWVKGIIESCVTPPGPVNLGTSYFESGKYSGFKSEKTTYVTEYEQDRLFTLATGPEIRPSFRETYQIESLNEETCRVKFIIEIDGAPRVAEFFMSQAMKKEQPKTSERLKDVLARKNR